MITDNSEPPLLVKIDLMIINITRMSIFLVSRLQCEQYLIDLSQEIIVARTKTFKTTLLCLLLPINLLFLASCCSLKAICIYSAVSERNNIGLTCVFYRGYVRFTFQESSSLQIFLQIFFQIYIFFLSIFFHTVGLRSFLLQGGAIGTKWGLTQWKPLRPTTSPRGWAHPPARSDSAL